MIAYLMIVDQFMYSNSDLDGKHYSHHGGVGSPSVWYGLRHYCKGAWTEAYQKCRLISRVDRGVYILF